MLRVRPALFSLLAPLIVLLLCAQAAFAASQVGKLVQVEGGVTLRREGASHPAKTSDPVQLGDTIVTAADGKASVRFVDDSVLVLGNASQTRIDDYVYEGGNAKLLARFVKGSFRAVTGKIVKQNPQGFNMLTPLATIGVRGSDIFALVQPGEELIGALQLGEGHKLEVKAGKGRGEMDAGGLYTRLTPDGAMSEPLRITPELLSIITQQLSSPAAPPIDSYVFRPQTGGQPGPAQNGATVTPTVPMTNVPNVRSPTSTYGSSPPTSYVPSRR